MRARRHLLHQCQQHQGVGIDRIKSNALQQCCFGAVVLLELETAAGDGSTHTGAAGRGVGLHCLGEVAKCNFIPLRRVAHHSQSNESTEHVLFQCVRLPLRGAVVHELEMGFRTIQVTLHNFEKAADQPGVVVDALLFIERLQVLGQLPLIFWSITPSGTRTELLLLLLRPREVSKGFRGECHKYIDDAFRVIIFILLTV
mmetsp:Transcript_29846/g.50429  ORF Transcript_29846/g.50429 Transcript_29846/m.50429 type:complete len:200 (+) Transcript_29846:562-1161(+)